MLESETVDVSQPVDVASVNPPHSQTHFSSLPFPFTSFVELKPGPNIFERESDIVSSVAQQAISASPEKPAIWASPLQQAFDVAQFTATAPLFAPAQSSISGHLDLAGNMVWLDQLAREIVAVAANDGRLKFSLSPATLGTLDVVINTNADGINIQLHPSTEAAARIFAAEQPKLSEELRQSGIKLINTELLNGQQMGSAHDHSHAHRPNRQIPFHISGQPKLPASLNPSSMQPQRGRFA
jgi:flagellar hook-length control protein FliK